MGQTVYLECTSGISGDMTVASLLDLGADVEVLRKALKSLPVQGFEIEIGRVKKAGLDVCDFNVKLDKAHENHDHDMEYLHGHEHPHEHSHGHLHEHPHKHSHGEDAHEYLHEHSHEHRGLPEILEIIDKAEITFRARDIAIRIFRILAEAEAKAHGVALEQVHFHEVGAVDSIVDIVAAAVCLDNLDITELIVPFVCEGSGTVRCQHGILPVPVPAVANIMEAYKLPVRFTDVEGELVTPTGAAILAAAGTFQKLPQQFVIRKVGMGAGKRSYEGPGFLRAMLIEKSIQEEDFIYKLETNIDDCTGEALSYVMKRLLDAGARDVYFTPIYMKKNRPAYELSVICDEYNRESLEQIIFEETTTIGIRRMKLERTVLPRECAKVVLNEGEIKAKKCTLPDGRVRYYPEYESALTLAQKRKIPLADVMDAFKRSTSGEDGYV